MSIDYRGLRLIEQVLEAEERRDNNLITNDNYNAYATFEASRLRILLSTWVVEKFYITDRDELAEKVRELLKAFRI